MSTGNDSTNWARYDDALRLILTGSANGPLSDEKQDIYRSMSAAGAPGRDCVPTIERDGQILYFIPRLARTMIEVCGLKVLNPPLALDYLNGLTDDKGANYFLFGQAPGIKAWEESRAGQDDWDLICRDLELEQKVAQLARTSDGGVALEIEARERLLEKYQAERKGIIEERAGRLQQYHAELNDYRDRVKETTREMFIAYPQAMRMLRERLNATPDELAMWIFRGPTDGGITAYLYANELSPPPRFRFGYSDEADPDYLAPLVQCWFLRKEIERYEPKSRYMTGRELIERWKGDPVVGDRVVPYIVGKIGESRLLDIHPIKGMTQGSQGEGFPPIESALFDRREVEEIENEDGIASPLTARSIDDNDRCLSQQLQLAQLPIDTRSYDTSRVRRDQMREEIDEAIRIVGENATASEVMSQLKKFASMEGSCIEDVGPDYVLWKRPSTNAPEKLTIKALRKRMGRRRKKDTTR